MTRPTLGSVPIRPPEQSAARLLRSETIQLKACGIDLGSKTIRFTACAIDLGSVPIKMPATDPAPPSAAKVREPPADLNERRTRDLIFQIETTEQLIAILP